MRFVHVLAVLLFCLPQAFAPLVHAHIGVDASPAAFHLPGLEEGNFLGNDVNAPVSLDHMEGTIVRAAKGVRQAHALFPFTPGLSPVSTSTRSVSCPAVVIVQPLAQAPPTGCPFFHASPRAPPV